MRQHTCFKLRHHVLFYLSSRYPDEYVLEDLDLSVADFIQRMMKSNFAGAWEEIGAETELEVNLQKS